MSGVTSVSLIQTLELHIQTVVTPQERIDALNAWAWVGWCADPELALSRAESARSLSYELLADGCPYWSGLADSLLNVAYIYIRTFRHDEIKSLIEDAALIYGDIEDRRGQLRCSYVRALNQFRQNALEGAYRGLQAGVTYDNLITSPDIVGLMQGLIGSIFVQLGDGETAFVFFEQAQFTLEGPQHRLLLGQVMAAQAQAYLLHGHLVQAITIATEAMQIQRQEEDWFSQYQTLRVLIRAYLQQGELAAARQMMESHAMIANLISPLVEEHRKLLLQAEVEYHHGKLDQADAYMSAAMMMIGRLRHPQDIIEMRQIAARIYLMKENYEWAFMHMDEIARLQEKMLTNEMQKRARHLTLPSVSAMVRHEIQEQTDRRDDLQQRVDELMRVLQMYDEVSSNLNADYVATLALDAALRLSGGQAGFIAVFHNDHWQLRQMVGQFDATPLMLDDTLYSQLAHRHTLLMAGEAMALPTFPRNENSRARLLVPLHISDRLVGLLNVETTQPVRFTYSVQQLMDTLKGFVAIALENAMLYERLGQQNEELQASLRTVTRLEQLKTDMIRLASHDLKNPLTVVKLYLSMMRMGNHNAFTPAQNGYIDTMEKSVRTMDRLINDILSLERIETMAISPIRDSFDLLECVRESVESFQVQALEKHQSLIFTTDLGQAIVLGDRSQLGEAMGNFISNAIKYTQDSGKIAVYLTRTASEIVFEVQDNGMGIQPQELSHIFNPSYRITNEHTTQISGTGWGLYLVRKIVDYHHGRITLHSTYGSGSTFGFVLPVGDA